MDNKEPEVANKKHDETRISITPSGFFGNDSNNIQSRENFITKEENDILLDFAKNIKHWDYTESVWNEEGVMTYDASFWADRVANAHSILKHDDGEKIFYIIKDLVERLKKDVDKFFKVDAFPTNPAIVRWLPGQYQMPHADKELHENGAEGPNDFPYFDLAGLFYLNDDYEGGQLYFPQHNIEFKPKAGAAYFFPGDKNYIHGVKEITSGVRYVIPFFWTILEHKD
jgi:hypothetical protein